MTSAEAVSRIRSNQIFQIQFDFIKLRFSLSNQTFQDFSVQDNFQEVMLERIQFKSGKSIKHRQL